MRNRLQTLIHGFLCGMLLGRAFTYAHAPAAFITAIGLTGVFIVGSALVLVLRRKA